MHVNYEKATFAGGCFWCTEAFFQQVKGVLAIQSGYIGGTVKHPSYREVCTGKTGHAEAVQLLFDSNIITYETLVKLFFSTHDPTTLNRQGQDKGTQYRSAVFYHSEEQKESVNCLIEQWTNENLFISPIVTQVVEATTFYEAEPEHQNYYKNNPNAGYCQYVIAPKIQQLRINWKELLHTY